MPASRLNIPWFTIFIAASILLHAAMLGLGGLWWWQAPEFELAFEPPPITLQLEEWVEPPVEPEPPPPEPVPEPEIIPEPEPEQIEPEPEPDPELEIEPEPEVLPEPIPPEPVPEPLPEPPPAEPPPAVTVVAMDLPTYLRNPSPPYPIEARRNKWEGTVLIRVEVSAAGRVISAAVVTSSGHAVLDTAALNAIKRWRFSPARMAGIATTATVDVPVAFSLHQPGNTR
jgi:protein TonB